MEFKGLMPVLMVKDVVETIDFYKDILGFSVMSTVPDKEPYVFAMMNASNVYVLFQEEKSIQEEYPLLEKFSIGGTFTLYIPVTDVNAIFERVKGKATIVKEMHKTFYGATEFAITDINGYVLVFSQEGC
ncbi:MAG: VOC family protein [Candidatus Cloacimonetes bacterium]|nr:VOC family protein [Candidatus Cloacimonadota bacterium]